MWLGGQCQAPATLPPAKGPDTHCVGVWMEPKACLEGCREYRPHQDFLFSLSILYLHCFVVIVLALLFVLIVQHTQHKHPCPRRDSNPQPKQAIGCRPSP